VGRRHATEVTEAVAEKYEAADHGLRDVVGERHPASARDWRQQWLQPGLLCDPEKECAVAECEHHGGKVTRDATVQQHQRKPARDENDRDHGGYRVLLCSRADSSRTPQDHAEQKQRERSRDHSSVQRHQHL
jgi:hypothetical protein